MFREFRNLRRQSDRLGGFPDLLNYAALIDPGTVLLKDGSLLAGWFCQISGSALAFGVGGAVILVMTLFGFLTAPWPMLARSKSRRLRRA